MKHLVLIAVAVMLAGSAAAARDPEPLSRLQHLQDLAIKPEKPERLYLATARGLYLANSDGRMVLLSEGADDFGAVVPHPTEEKVVYASGQARIGGNAGLMMSTNGGQTWSQIGTGANNSPADFHPLVVSWADPETIYGVYGPLQVSHDGGATWTAVDQPPYGVEDLATSTLDVNRLYAATPSGLMISTDGGHRWTPVPGINGPVTTVHVNATGTIFVFVVNAGLMRATEADLTWTSVPTVPKSLYLRRLDVDPHDSNHIVADDDRFALMVTRDGGRHWKPYALPKDTIPRD